MVAIHYTLRDVASTIVTACSDMSHANRVLESIFLDKLEDNLRA